MPVPDVILDVPKGIYSDVIMHLSEYKRNNKKGTSKDKEEERRFMNRGIKTKKG